MPVLEDLIAASRSDQVQDMFAELKIQTTAETVSAVFARYIYDAIRKYPILNQPTKLDFGSARIIVLNLQEVAPTGSAASNRQTEMMYLLGRHILARNFFLRPDYVHYVPEAVRPYHAKRFREAYETVKRLDYDEWHRTLGSPQVRAQAELDAREGRKHNIQLGFASQRLSDMGDALISQSTGRFVLKAGDEREAEEVIARFNLTPASAAVVRHGLHGPGPGGAPFLAIMQIENSKYEQLLVNSLGPIELWALSTTPDDAALRNRLYEAVGFQEALRRLSKVFPAGSAQKEVERRRLERLRSGEMEARATESVLEGLAAEMIDGRGVALVLRPHDEEPARRGVGRRIAASRKTPSTPFRVRAALAEAFSSQVGANQHGPKVTSAASRREFSSLAGSPAAARDAGRDECRYARHAERRGRAPEEHGRDRARDWRGSERCNRPRPSHRSRRLFRASSSGWWRCRGTGRSMGR